MSGIHGSVGFTVVPMYHHFDTECQSHRDFKIEDRERITLVQLSHLCQMPKSKQNNTFNQFLFRSFLLCFFYVHTKGAFQSMPGVPVPLVRGDESVLYRSPLTHMASSRAPTCPPTCFCSKLTWNCDSARLTEAPLGMPPTLLSASFHNNYITYIPPNFLKDLPLLQTIDLRNNLISNISSSAFSNLPELVTVLLDDNRIGSIEYGSFVNLPALEHIRLRNNSIRALRAGTFEDLPNLKLVRITNNYDLDTIEPGSFRRLERLEKIQLNGTKTNYTHLGPYDYGLGEGSRTFAPDCPKLREIDLGRMKIRAIEPDTLQDSSILVRVRRVGVYLQYSTLMSECDLLFENEIIIEFDTVSSTTLCVPSQGARLADSPSRSQKDHLPGFNGGNGRRRVLSEDDLQLFERLVPGATPTRNKKLSNIPSTIHGMPVDYSDRQSLLDSIEAGIVYEESLI